MYSVLNDKPNSASTILFYYVLLVIQHLVKYLGRLYCKIYSGNTTSIFCNLILFFRKQRNRVNIVVVCNRYDMLCLVLLVMESGKCDFFPDQTFFIIGTYSSSKKTESMCTTYLYTTRLLFASWQELWYEFALQWSYTLVKWWFKLT